MKTTPNHGLSYVEGNDKPADYPLISQENMTKLDTLIQQLIDGKASLSHNHSIGQIMGLTEDLAAKADQQATATALAAKANQAAVDTALAGKAPTTHTHTMGQVTGLDTALAGKANQAAVDTALAGKADKTTLDTRIPSTLALRLDTTVGTRIFAGTTMVYGTTGWRSITANLGADWEVASVVPRAQIMRIGNMVHFEARLSRKTTGPRAARSTILTIPPGFIGIGFEAITGTAHLFRDKQRGTLSTYASANLLSLDDLTGEWVVGDMLIVSAQWTTAQGWPAALPGTPA